MEKLSHEKRTEILDAAVQLFSERGFDRTTVDEIAGRAGVGKGTIYLYFQNKEQIFRAAIAQCLEDILNILQDIVEGEGDFMTRFTLLVRRNLQYIEYKQSFYQVFIKERVNLMLCEKESQQRMIEMHQRMHDVMTGFIRSGIDQGYLRPGNPDFYTIAISGIVSHFGIHWLMTGCPGTLADQTDQLLDILMKGIKST